jgi:hypothetical protein
LALALSVSLVVPWVLAYQSLKPLGDWRVPLVFGFLVVAWALGLIAWRRQVAILPDVLQILVDHLTHAGTCTESACNPVKAYRELTKGLSVVAIIGLVFSCSATLLAGARDLHYLADQTRRLRIGLFIAAALLVAGVMEVSLLLHWPTARLPARDAAAIIALADTVSIGNGTVLSLLLVATYGVASLVVLDRVRERAAEIEPDRTRREEWLADNDLASMPTQQLLRVLALVAPLVAGGPLTSLFESPRR